MPYRVDMSIQVHKKKERDTWWVHLHNTPYGCISGRGGTLIEALQNFDYNYVVTKDRKEHD